MLTIAIVTLGLIAGNVGTPIPHAERTKQLSALIASSVGGVQALAMLDLASERRFQMHVMEVWRAKEAREMTAQSEAGSYREAGAALERVSTLKYAHDQFVEQVEQLGVQFGALAESSRVAAYMNAFARLDPDLSLEEMRDLSKKFAATGAQEFSAIGALLTAELFVADGLTKDGHRWLRGAGRACSVDPCLAFVDERVARQYMEDGESLAALERLASARRRLPEGSATHERVSGQLATLEAQQVVIAEQFERDLKWDEATTIYQVLVVAFVGDYALKLARVAERRQLFTLQAAVAALDDAMLPLDLTTLERTLVGMKVVPDEAVVVLGLLRDRVIALAMAKASAPAFVRESGWFKLALEFLARRAPEGPERAAYQVRCGALYEKLGEAKTALGIYAAVVGEMPVDQSALASALRIVALHQHLRGGESD